MKKLFLAVFVIGIVFASWLAQAHTGGFTYEVSIGNYFVDIGSTKLNFVEDELSLFELNLYHKDDPNNLADFDNVYVTISDSEQTIFTTFVHRPQDMLTVMSYAFPEPGTYLMSTRFQKGGQQLVEAEFDVQVGKTGGVDPQILIGVLAAVVGLAAGWSISSSRKKTVNE